MVLAVKFGTGGSSALDALVGALAEEVKALNAPVVGNDDIPRDGLVSEVETVEVPFAAPGGTVDISRGGGYLTFDVAGDWNSVKNFYAESDDAAWLNIHDFVHVDVNLSGDTASAVNIYNVKRGNVVTGDGDDSIRISLLANDDTWVNTFNVQSGGGNDQIRFFEGDTATAGNNEDGNNKWIVGASGSKAVTDGSYTSVVVDAGEGNDLIDLSRVKLKSSEVTGGQGADEIYASQGADLFLFNEGDSQPVSEALNGTDFINGFDAANDEIRVYGNETDWTVSYNNGAQFGVVFYELSNAATGDVIRIADTGTDFTANQDWLTFA